MIVTKGGHTNNTFAAGILDLSVDSTTIVDIDNLKPGDSMARTFELTNEGSLDIDTVYLETDYIIDDTEGNNTADFGEHILVELLYNVDELREVVYETTLAELKNMTPEAINEHIFDPMFDSLEAGSENDLFVNFVFVDNGEDQNQFQGDTLNLT